MVCFEERDYFSQSKWSVYTAGPLFNRGGRCALERRGGWKEENNGEIESF